MSRFWGPAGGFGWLFAHELRLAYRSLGRGAAKQMWPLLLFCAFPILGGIAGGIALGALPTPPLGDLAIKIASVVVLGLLGFMLPPAAAGVLRAFHDRADLDLLLSAPVPPGRVLAAKAVGLYASVPLVPLILFGPFLLTYALMGHRPGLGGILMILVDAVAATGLAFVVARALYRLIGPRRARTVVQVGTGLIGGSVFLAFQARNIAPEFTIDLAHRIAAAPAPAAPFNWPALAALGAPWPMLAMLALAAAMAWLGTRTAARVIADPPSETRRARVLREGTPRFARGLTRIIVGKELRLIARDPDLLAQVTLRLVYLIPVVALVFRGAHEFDAARLAAAAAVFAGFLASSLGWLTVCAEDAPELIAAAPVPAATIARAKWIAAAAPPWLLALLPAALAASQDLWAGLAAMVGAGLAASSSAAVQGWLGKPAKRAAFKKRQREGWLVGILELFLAGGWSGATYLVAHGSPLALLPALLAIGIVYAANAEREKRLVTV